MAKPAAVDKPDPLRRAIVRAAIVVPAATVLPAAEVVTSRAANASGLEVDPRSPNPYVDDPTGAFTVQQPISKEKLSKPEVALLKKAIMSEIAEVIGLPRSTDADAVLEAMRKPELKGLHDKVTRDGLLDIFENERRNRHIVPISRPYADAIVRGLSHKSVETFSEGITVGLYIKSYRPGLVKVGSVADERPLPR